MTASALPRELVDLANFARPRPPASNRLRDLAKRAWSRFSDAESRDPEDFPDMQHWEDGSLFRDGMWERLEAHVFGLLDAAYGDWIATPGSPKRVHACLGLPSLPPGLFARWAAARGHPVIDSDGIEDAADFAVLPDFDQLIRRDLSGMRRLRDFCRRLEAHRGKLLICGTTFQWRYLCRISGLDMVVTDIRVLPVFDALALRAILQEECRIDQIKSRETGKDILALSAKSTKSNSGNKDKETPKLADPYLLDLSNQTGGCPWSALRLLGDNMYRASRDKDGTDGPNGPDSGASAADSGGTSDAPKPDDPDAPDAPDRARDAPTDAGSLDAEDTAWVSRTDLPAVTGPYARVTLFFLHALLLRGAVAPDAVDTLLPMRLPPGLVRYVERMNLVIRTEPGGLLRPTPHMVPHIRQLLAEDGFPVDEV